MAALRSVWPTVAAGSALVVAVLAASAWAVSSVAHAPLLGGFCLGGGLAAYAAALHWIVDLLSGEHNNKFGTIGEESTSEAFRSRAMRRRGWRILDSIAFDERFGDVDHVAVRPGLIVAVETKWTNTPWKIVDGHLEARGNPLRNVRTGADRIRRLLKHLVEVDVLSVVVVWGPGAATLPADVTDLGGMLIVRGGAVNAIDDWLDAFIARHPTEAEIPGVLDVIAEFAERRDKYEEAKSRRQLAASDA